jgi:hypothetical protein
MSKLKVLSSALAELHTIEAVTRCSKHEAINSDNTLYFEMLLSSENKDWINDTNLIGIDGDYFDIAHYRAEANQRGELTVSVDCEHVSYRLNDPQFDEEYFAATGTPEEILTAILSGTGFTVGTVQFSGNHTYSAQEKMSRRAILVQFTEYLGGELLFCGFTVSILTQRGSSTAKNLTSGHNIAIISKDVDKTQRDEHDNPITAYECELIEPMPLELGDVVTLDYDTLGINISLRIVSITTNPYNSAEVSFSVSNTVPTIEDEAYEIKTSTVGKDKLYNGCRIGPEYGFENMRSDGKFRSYFRADEFKMQTKDGDSWKDRLSVVYDEDAGEYDILFNGKLSLTSTAHLATNAAMGEAIAQVLSDAEAYADGVGAAIELSVAATYETKTAAAQLLLDAKSYADGIVSSASASLSASIGDVSASLSLFASYADGAYQSKATLSADVVSILSSTLKIIGSGGTATIIDADIYADEVMSFTDYNAAYASNGYRGYYGGLARLSNGSAEFWSIDPSGGGDGFGLIYSYDNPYNPALEMASVTGINLNIVSGKELRLWSDDGLILDSSMYGTSTSGKTPTACRLFFVKA